MRTLRWRWKAEWGEKKECRRDADVAPRWMWRAEWGEKKECWRDADAALGEEGVMERENAALVVEVGGYRKIKEWCDRMGWCIM